MEPEDLDPVQAAEENIVLANDAGIDPSTVGKIQDLSEATSIDPSTLRSQTPSYLSSLEGKKTRTDVLRRRADLATWAAENPVAAQVAQNDMAKMEQIANLMPYWQQQAAQFHKTTTAEGVSASLKAIARAPGTALGSLGRSAYGLIQAGADYYGLDAVSEYAQDKASISANLNAYLNAAVAGTSLEEAERHQAQITARDLLHVTKLGLDLSPETILSTIYAMAPVFVGSAIGGVAGGVFAAGLQQAGSTYADAKDRGDPANKALLVATTSGLITALVTRLMPGVAGSFARTLAAAPSKSVAVKALFTQTLGKVAAEEFGEEALDQIGQTLLMELSDSTSTKGFSEILQKALAEGLNAGVIGGLTGATIGVGEARHHARQQAATNFHDQNVQLAKAIDASETAKQSKSIIRGFLQSNGMRDSKSHLTEEDAAPLLRTADAEGRIALAEAGLTEASLEAIKGTGSTIALDTARVHTLAPGLRDIIIENGRQTPHAPNKVELDQEAEQPQAPADDQKTFTAELRKQENRIVKELTQASGIDDATARAQFSTLAAFARSLFAADPLAARSPIDFLRKVRFNKGSLSQQGIRQIMVDMAGPEGKTALAGLTFKALGQASARYDALTGQLEIDDTVASDTIQVAEVLKHVEGSKLDLKGRTVTGPDGSQVDAAEAVGTLRRKVESARRLAGCLG
jgi:hypothetical protein